MIVLKSNGYNHAILKIKLIRAYYFFYTVYSKAC